MIFSKEIGDWVPGPAHLEFLQRLRTANLEGARRMEKVRGDHHNISMAKAMSCDPVFGADQDQDQVSEADQAGDKPATTNAYLRYSASCETDGESATEHAYDLYMALKYLGRAKGKVRH